MKSVDFRNDPMFLRNQLARDGTFEMPVAVQIHQVFKNRWYADGKAALYGGLQGNAAED